MKRLLKNFICLLCFAVMATGVPALAQQTKIQIKGTVTSKADKEPLVGVVVSEIDKDNRMLSSQLTDIDGVYTIKVTPGSRLTFNYLSYASQTVSLDNRTVVNVQLVDESTLLDVVEVKTERQFNQGPLSINQRDLTGSVATVNASDLESIQVASIDEALQGRMAGVDIVATSGDPGQGMQIRIRGTNSLTGDNQPLIVINGVPFETTIDPDFDFANADEEQYGALISVAPEDIEEISVLKDAASTAVWGSKAANGVLNIVTKRGKRGVPQINYVFKSSISKQGDQIPMLNGDQYSTLIMDMLNNQADGTPFNPVTYREFTYDPNDPYYFYNFGQNTDWVGAVTQTAVTQDHSVSLSGGGDKARYRMSLGYLSQGGTTIGTGLKRLSSTLQLDYDVSEKIRFTTDFSYTRSESEANYSNVLSEAYSKLPNMSIYEWQQNADGEWVQTPNYFIPQTISGVTQWNVTSTSGKFNPVAMANLGVSDVIDERLRPQFNLSYRVAKWLKYDATASFDVRNSKTSKFLPQETIGSNFTGYVNLATGSESENVAMMTFNKLTFTPNLGDMHSLVVFLQYQVDQSLSRSSTVTTANSPTSMMRDPSIPARIKKSALGTTSSEGESRDVSALMLINYSALNSRYVANVTIRRDGNYKFAPQERFKTFPAISARWNIDREPFMRSLKGSLKINDLSIRGSWGINGSGGSNSQYNTYSAVGYEYLGTSGIVPSNIAIQALKWQKTYSSSVEANVDMFDGRLGLTYSYYQKRTKDMAGSGTEITSVSGFSGITSNAGALKNDGWEFLINAQLVNKKEYGVTFSFNISQQRNMITELSPSWNLAQGNMYNNGTYFQTIRVNNPVGSFYGYRYLGVYANDDQLVVRNSDGDPIYVPDGSGGWMERTMTFYSSMNGGYSFQAGDAIYKDVNNDGNIDIQDIEYLGNSNPKYIGGGGLTFRYKQLSLNLYFNYRYGNDILNSAKMNLEKMVDLSNQSTAVLRRWRYPYANAEDQPDDILPRPVYGSNNAYNYLGSDRFVEDGSMLRLNSLTFKYNFPKNLLSKLKLKQMFFSFNMKNMFTWTNYTGQDPEVGNGSVPYGIASDNSKTPPSKSYQFTLNVSF